MLRRLGWAGIGALVLGAVACTDDGMLPIPAGPEVVAAAMPATMPGGAVAVRYWGEIDPKAGRVDLYPIHEGNLIYRHERVTSAVNYQYGTATQENTCAPGATCLPSINTVRLFTDQNTVTYVEDSDGGVDDGDPADDDCYHNGAFIDNDPTCGGIYAAGNACTKNQVFCGDIQLTSNVTFGGLVGAMPDVVIDIGNPVGASPPPILGCRRNNTLGGTSGLCTDDAPAKIAAATSNFVAQISPASTTFPCAYCYGNKATAVATGRPALEHAVISGATAEKAAVNTNKTVLKLSSGNGFSTTLIVYYAEPAVNVPGTQIGYANLNGPGAACVKDSPATSAFVRGGGFGPPADCMADALPGACPLAGAPAAGYELGLAGLAGQAPLEWSDTLVSSQDLPNFYGCPVTVSTPIGSITTDDDIKKCPGTYRRWTPAAYSGRTRAGGGVLNDFVVVMGGLTAASVATSGANTIQVMPIPRCADTSPAFTTLTTTLPAGAGLWGAASTVASDGLYYIGGADSGNTCSSQAFHFAYAGGVSGTLTALPDLPVQLCHATAVTLFSADDGTEHVVVTGGLTRPVFRTPQNAPSPSIADLAPRATYIWDVGGAAWRPFGGVRGIQRWNMAGAGYQDPDPSFNKAIFAGGATAVANGAPAVATVDVLQIFGGAPFFNLFAVPALPAGRSAAAIVVLGGNFYVQGGAININPQNAARREMYRLAAQPMGLSWANLGTGSLPRSGHLAILSDFDETEPADDLSRIIFVSGSHYQAFAIPDEFNP